MHFTPIISTNFDDQTSSEDLNNGKTHELIDPTHPSTPLCRLSPPSILDKPVVVKYIHSHDMFSRKIPCLNEHAHSQYDYISILAIYSALL